MGKLHMLVGLPQINTPRLTPLCQEAFKKGAFFNKEVTSFKSATNPQRRYENK
jgi:hypothetical protein